MHYLNFSAPPLAAYGIPNQNPTIEAPHDTAEASSSYGPALPPHLLPVERKFGPTLPENIDELVTTAAESDEELDADCVGPLPGVSNPKLEERALEIKLGLVPESTKETEDGREAWMLELPKVKGVTDLGLGARQFRTKERPDFSDRSEWTDTPGDREKKRAGPKLPTAADKARELEIIAVKARDAEQEKIAKKLNKKRDKSLMDLHEEKLKKAKKETEDEPQARRPFDRNLDLQVNRFDEAQKKSVIKKAQLLDSRFSSGASKYL